MTKSISPRRRTATGWDIRWDDARAEAAYAGGHWCTATIADTLEAIAGAEPDRILIIDGDVHLNAAELFARARRLASVLRQSFDPGNVVSFMLPNWHEAAVIYMAVTMAGMVAHPILPSLRDHDLKFMLADCFSRMVFIPDCFRGFDYGAMLGRVTTEMENPPVIVSVRGRAHIPFGSLIAEGVGEEFAPPHPDDVRMLMYTSGTTGRPRGVLHSHNSMHALIRQIGASWQIDRSDRFLVASPVSHIGGSIYAFECPILLGTTAILMESWDAPAAVAIMEHQRVTHMAGATPFLSGLLAAARAVDTRLPDLNVFICGGASVPPALIQDANAYFAHAAVTRVYGSTEVPVTTVGSFDNLEAAAHSDGRAGIAEIKIGPLDEICARGPQMFVGYLHPEDALNAFDADGYYRTGDQGQLDGSGHLVVTGRIKDIIIRNGENIAPKEIEDLLGRHPDIAEIAIVGVPDLRTGERAVAVIVSHAQTIPDVASLGAFLSKYGIAKFKYPEAVICWNSLPKNDAGKVLKAAIRAKLLEDTQTP